LIISADRTSSRGLKTMSKWGTPKIHPAPTIIAEYMTPAIVALIAVVAAAAADNASLDIVQMRWGKSFLES
jgi:hypothetical protein